MRKYILKHSQMINTFDTKIILHNYILYKGEPSYIGTFPVDLDASGFPTLHMVKTHPSVAILKYIVPTFGSS